MSSLFSKLKALVNAGARGPRRYKRKTRPQGEAAKARPVSEVTEAPAHRRELPEVTEAPQIEQKIEQIETPTRKRPTQLEEPETDQTQSDALEEGRVADLLKDRKK